MSVKNMREGNFEELKRIMGEKNSLVCSCCGRDFQKAIKDGTFDSQEGHYTIYILKLKDYVNLNKPKLKVINDGIRIKRPKNQTTFAFCEWEHLCEFVENNDILIDQIDKVITLFQVYDVTITREEKDLDHIARFFEEYFNDDCPEDIPIFEGEEITEMSESEIWNICLCSSCSFCGDESITNLSELRRYGAYILILKDESDSRNSTYAEIFCCVNHLFQYIKNNNITKEKIEKMYTCRFDEYASQLRIYLGDLDALYEYLK